MAGGLQGTRTLEIEWTGPFDTTQREAVIREAIQRTHRLEPGAARPPVARRWLAQGQAASCDQSPGQSAGLGAAVPPRAIGERANLVADLVVTAGLALWFALVSYPLLRLTSWEAYQEAGAEGALAVWQLLGLATGIAALGTANLLRGVRLVPPGEGVKVGILAFMLLALVVQTLFSTSPLLSLQYLLLTCISFVLMPTIWRMPERSVRRLAFVLCVVLSGFLLAAPALHGMPQNRWFGGIQPNQYGEACLVILSLVFLLRTPLRFIFLALAVLGMVVVNTRGGLAVGLLFMLIWFATDLTRINMPKVAVLGAAAVVAVVIAALATGIDPVETVTEQIVRSDQEGRSLATLSGRTEKWELGIEAFLDNIAVGVGFRVSRSSDYAFAHSGILQLLIDLGLIGVLVLFLLFVASARLLWASRQMRRHSEFHADLMRWGGAFGLAYLTRALIEPNLLSFGNVMSLTFIAAISVPVFRIQGSTEPSRAPTAPPPSPFPKGRHERGRHPDNAALPHWSLGLSRAAGR